MRHDTSCNCFNSQSKSKVMASLKVRRLTLLERQVSYMTKIPMRGIEVNLSISLSTWTRITQAKCLHVCELISPFVWNKTMECLNHHIMWKCCEFAVLMWQRLINSNQPSWGENHFQEQIYNTKDFYFCGNWHLNAFIYIEAKSMTNCKVFKNRIIVFFVSSASHCK